jgi:hypothetical protein
VILEVCGLSESQDLFNGLQESLFIFRVENNLQSPFSILLV